MKTKGMTLIELLICIGIIVIIAGIIFSHTSKPAKADIQQEAAQYATELGIKYKAIVCVDMDTNSDGYISCTISTIDDKLIGIECANPNALYSNSGCKPKALQNN